MTLRLKQFISVLGRINLTLTLCYAVFSLIALIPGASQLGIIISFGVIVSLALVIQSINNSFKEMRDMVKLSEDQEKKITKTDKALIVLTSILLGSISGASCAFLPDFLGIFAGFSPLVVFGIITPLFSATFGASMIYTTKHTIKSSLPLTKVAAAQQVTLQQTARCLTYKQN